MPSPSLRNQNKVQFEPELVNATSCSVTSTSFSWMTQPSVSLLLAVPHPIRLSVLMTSPTLSLQPVLPTPGGEMSTTTARILFLSLMVTR